MSFIDGLKIRNKILLSIVLLGAIAAAAVAFLSLSLVQSSAAFQQLIFGPRLAARVAVEWQGALSEMGRVINLALLQGDKVDAEDIKARLGKIADKRRSSRETLVKLAPAYASQWTEMAATATSLNAATGKLLEFLQKPGGGAAAMAFWDENGRPILTKQREFLQTVADQLTTSSNAETAALAASVERAVLVASAGAAAAIVLAVLFALYIVQARVVRPLTVLTDKTVRLSRGEDDFDLSEAQRRDEIGLLGKALLTFKENAATLRAMTKAEAVTKQIGEVIGAAAGKDFRSRVDLTITEGFLKDIGAAVNRLLDTCADAFRDFTQRATETSLSVDEASSAVGQISDGARVQTTQLAQVSSALTDAAQAIRSVTQTAGDARDKAEKAARAVEAGKTAVDQLATIVDAITENSRKVNQITQVIAQIADRTHILSLNAAIEAARAGEHGKGFVVVAQEVGKLAESSAQNAKQIADIVEQASQEAQQGKTAARTVGDCMVDIEGGTGETTTMIRSIAVAMDEQQATVAQIEGNVTELKTVALTNSSSAEEIAATMIQLSKQSNLMRQRLAEFGTT